MEEKLISGSIFWSELVLFSFTVGKDPINNQKCLWDFLEKTCPIFVLCKQIYHLAKGSVPVRAMRDMRSWLKPKVYPGYLLESSPAELSHTQQTQNPIYKCYSVIQSCPTLCGSMDCSTAGFPVLHSLLEFAQTHVHWVDDAIQPFHPLLPTSPSTLNLSQHQGLFQWVISLHQVAKVLELQL